MGTTLTGTTPANTYDSLIKVTDNGPLSGTAKYLSDGLGNDSALALSNSLVGVNTNTPSNFLQVTDPNSSVGGAQLTLEGRATGYGAGVIFASRVDNSSGALVPMAKITGDGEDSWTSTASTQDAGMRLYTATDGSLTEKMRITSTGNVGIGTTSPAAKLHVKDSATSGSIIIDNTGTTGGGFLLARQNGSNAAIFGVSGAVVGDTSNDAAVFAETGRSIRFFANGSASEVARITSNGLTFNGDTAAANALDDYEEGTFTPTTAGDATGAFSATRGEYTKVGNIVTFRLIATISANFTDNFIGGLPFIVGGLNNISGISGSINVANNSSTTLTANIECAGTSVRFYDGNSTATQVPPTTAMGTLRMFGTYRV